MSDGAFHRYSYRDFYGRINSLAHALKRLGLQEGEHVGALCWNSSRHLELYFAVPYAGWSSIFSIFV